MRAPVRTIGKKFGMLVPMHLQRHSARATTKSSMRLIRSPLVARRTLWLFSHHLDGVAYVTADLTGKPDACYADYELMICHRAPGDWGPNLISRLAPYTQQAYIGAGESIDIASATPAGSRIKAFLFDTYGAFLSVWARERASALHRITKPELEFKLRHGPERLLELLKRHGVHPFTDLDRDSVPLDD